MDFITYSEKLGVGFDDTYKQQFFLNVMFNYINGSSIEFPSSYEQAYVSQIGLAYRPIHTNDIRHLLIESLGNIWSYINRFKGFKSKLSAIVMLVNFFKKIGNDRDYGELFESLTSALDLAHIAYQLEEDEDGVFVFPKGDSFLDDGEVFKPLMLLDGFPKTRECFIAALKMYNDIDDSNASRIADQFRKTLERFFQEFFKADKSLEHFKSEYGTFLKEKGMTKELAGNFESILQAYTNFNNNHAKHKETTSKLVLEYLLYETGNIIRLLITLQEEK